MPREQGLRALTEELVLERLEAAHSHNEITAEEREELTREQFFAQNQKDVRADQVCLVLSRETFGNHADGCNPLLSKWGGEAIYQYNKPRRGRLETIGRPTIVVALLDLKSPPIWRRHVSYPGLLTSFVGAELGLLDQGADVLYRAAIPPEGIEDIWQPGHPEYDRHTGLVRQ